MTTAIASQTPVGPWPATPLVADSADLIFTAADMGGNKTVLTGRMLLLAHNVNVAAKTVTITSVADPDGRTGDITTYSIGASEKMAFLLDPVGWKNADGSVYYLANHVDVSFALVKLD